ncbi:hypothetical protein C9446_05695 [Providencia heimbachae]|nr:hypothetical protein C9446_05695 [Providencia heimbachae]
MIGVLSLELSDVTQYFSTPLLHFHLPSSRRQDHSRRRLTPNEVWPVHVTYLKTPKGWLYLAIVMNLYSRRIVDWHIFQVLI